MCGPLRVELDGRRVEALLPARPGRLLFAYLVLRRRRAVGRDELVEALWPHGAPADPHAVLNTLVARLRAALGAGTVAGRGELSLVLGPDPWIDVETAQAAVEAARAQLRAGSAEAAGSRAEEALAIIDQPLLRDLDRTWLDDQRRQLEALRPALLALIGDAALALGGSALARGTEAARALTLLEPFRESARALLIRLLVSAGDVAEALRVYDDLRVHLRDELGTVPSPQLTTLHERLLTAPEAVVAACAERRRARAGAPQDRPPDAGERRLAMPRALQPVAGQLPFTGREQQLDHLTDCWAAVDGGGSRAVVISGEAGIGKTRVAAELAARVVDGGSPVLYGRCDEGLAVPYQPFVEALRSLLQTLDADDVRRQLGGLAPELGRLLPEFSGAGSPAPADAESARFALFESVVALLEVASARQRALLVIDDVQWAAPATLLLLRHVVRSERPLALLIVVTFRSTELQPDEPLATLLCDLWRDNSAEALALEGLDERGIDVLLRAAVGADLGHDASDERASALVHALASQTAGNPFFLRELLAHMVEAARRSGSETSRASVTVAQLQAPEGLRQVILQRVARLSASAGHVLRAGAVAGAGFSFPLLERVLGDRCDVLDALDEAVGAGLLGEAGRGEYVFAHALVRQTLYGQLGAARRMRLHRQLGEALEAHGDVDAHVEALAHHFAQAAADGQAVKAATYALSAGRSATVRLGHEEAAAHYERGLDALALTGRPLHELRCELLLALGDARWSTGELDKARRAYEQAAELAEQQGDATALAQAALGFCGPHRFERDEAVARSAELLRRALVASGEQDSPLRARLMGRLGAALAHTGVEHGTPAIAHQALQMARRVADRAALADVLASTLWATRGPDHPRDSLAMARELRLVADEVGDDASRALAHLRLLDLLLEVADIDAVQRELEALQRLAQGRTERYFPWLVAVLRFSQAFLEGRLEDCESLAHDALAHRFEGQDEVAARIFRTHMLVLRHEQGRLDEVVQAVKSIAERSSQVAVLRCILALNLAQLGQTAQARRELEELARNDFCELPRDETWLPSLSALCGAVSLLGDAPRAQLLYELLLPHADRCLVPGALLCMGSVSRLLGLMATTLSRYEDAQRHFERALEMSIRIRSPLWIGYTQLGYARMLALRNEPGDDDEARRLVTEALARAEELGLKALADMARRLKLTIEAPGPSRAPATVA